MCLVGVTMQTLRIGEDGIGKVVVLIDEEINFTVRLLPKRRGRLKKKKLIRIFYYGNKAGFVYIITIVAANHGEVHHAVRDAFPFGCYIFFHN